MCESPAILPVIKAGPSRGEAQRHHDFMWRRADAPLRCRSRCSPFAGNHAALRQAALPPRLLHAERKALRSLPCRPLAVAWSEHAFEITFLSVSLVDFAAELRCAARGFAVGAVCAIVALEPISTANAVIINAARRRPRAQRLRYSAAEDVFGPS